MYPGWILQARKEEKVELRGGELFAAMAEAVPCTLCRGRTYKGLVRQIDEYLIHAGQRSLSEITPIEIMGILTSLRSGRRDGKSGFGDLSQIFRRAVATGKAKSDPAGFCGRWLRHRKSTMPPDHERWCAFMMRASMRIRAALWCAAVRFTALTFVRQVELRLLHGMRSIGKRGCG